MSDTTRGVARGSTADASSAWVVTSGGTPSPRELDVGGGKVYWADAGLDRIQRANLDGSGGAEGLVNTGQLAPNALAVDVVNGKVYGSDDGTGAANDTSLQWADLTGSNADVLLAGRGSIPSMVVDPAGTLYWTEGEDIWAAGLDGTSPSVLLPGVGARVLALD